MKQENTAFEIKVTYSWPPVKYEIPTLLLFSSHVTALTGTQPQTTPVKDLTLNARVRKPHCLCSSLREILEHGYSIKFTWARRHCSLPSSQAAAMSSASPTQLPVNTHPLLCPGHPIQQACDSKCYTGRIHCKGSLGFAPHTASLGYRRYQKDQIVRAVSSEEGSASDTPASAIQQAPRRTRKQGNLFAIVHGKIFLARDDFGSNAVSSSNKRASGSKRTGRRKKSAGEKSEVANKGNSGETERFRKNQDKNLQVEEEAKDDMDAFQYAWPPLVCCFGAAFNEFVHTTRTDRQLDPDLYSTWKSLHWSLPELVRTQGPPCNVAVLLVRLGGRAEFMGKVGDDPFGRQMVLALNMNRVQTRGIRFDPCVCTSVSYMGLTRLGGKFAFRCIKPCAEDSLLSSEINVDVLKEARMFHFNSMVLLAQSMHSTLFAAIKLSKKFGGIIFFDVNLPLPLWRSRDETRRIIQEAWNAADVIKVTKQELEFLLDEDYYGKKRKSNLGYYSRPVSKMENQPENYHYTQKEISPLWHDNIKIMFVTDSTRRIHYYTSAFDGSVTGTEDVLVSPFSCDRSASDDAIVAGFNSVTCASVAGIMRKLTIEPETYNNQENLEKALRFAICSGIIAQWRIGGIRVFPTERAAKDAKEQLYSSFIC
eukprot:Gb_38659 [translate_table: standard]